MSVAASISQRLEVIVPTLQMSVSYLSPTPIARVVARGEVLRFSSSSVVMQGALRDAAGKVLAVATATAVPRPFPPLPACGVGVRASHSSQVWLPLALALSPRC